MIKVIGSSNEEAGNIIDSYNFNSLNIPITIKVIEIANEFVPIYQVSIASLSKATEVILEKIREEIIENVNLGMIDITEKGSGVEEGFTKQVSLIVEKYFPDADKDTLNFLSTYLVQKSLGLGSVEILMSDSQLEEIAINSSKEPVWVYHRKHGWLKSNVVLESEDQILSYAATIGRRVGRQISILEPLMDANLSTGDRVNATLNPISNDGNTITLRKFATKPWTITDMIRNSTISIEGASFLWFAMQYETSTLFTGGTATGKTSILNVGASFFPPNQRIISIEDTRELQLPKYLHWVPMVTRLPNPEGKGEVSMLDLLVNSLRMRPDRIVVGEIRRKREAEVLFEAIHTGHSVYATFHANDSREAVTRLSNPPIEVPKTMLPSIPMVIVMYRNRRTGLRRIFQISEILEDSDYNVIYQLDLKDCLLKKVSESKAIIPGIIKFTGFSKKQISDNLDEKQKILKWLIKYNINDVHDVGKIIAHYYTDKTELMKLVNKKLLK